MNSSKGKPTFKEFLLEKKEEKKKPKKVFIETHPQEPFPNDTISALKKHINKQAKDLDQDWSSAQELVDSAFDELEVPKPMAHLKQRWPQYTALLKIAIKDLFDSRGFKAGWSKTT